jgi:hypothetical protein
MFFYVNLAKASVLIHSINPLATPISGTPAPKATLTGCCNCTQLLPLSLPNVLGQLTALRVVVLQRLLGEHDDVHLSALGMAVSTMVSIVEILKKDGLAVETRKHVRANAECRCLTYAACSWHTFPVCCLQQPATECEVHSGTSTSPAAAVDWVVFVKHCFDLCLRINATP